MKYSIDKRDKFCTLRLDEERLNSIISPKLKSEFVILNAEGFKNIILDLSEVRFIDSSGLSSVLVGNRLCKESNGSFILSCVHENVKKMIKISQLESILMTAPSLDEASDLVMMGELERDIQGE